MPYKQKRSCPVCGKRDLKTIHTHLRNVHKFDREQRKPLLKEAKHSSWLTEYGPEYAQEIPAASTSTGNVVRKKSRKPVKASQNILATEPYPDFTFKHKFSLLVIAPTQSGKTYFVKELLQHDRIQYGNNKRRRIMWYYGQKQPIYNDMKRIIGKEITFVEGLPEFEDNLSDLDDTYNNIIVLDDLMDLAKDSVIVSKLFTQGRHRNASVILLLQNAFPKGKYNTDISRNAQYIALWKCPSDRKQVGMLAERIFEKRRSEFMTVYNHVTAEAYQYVLVDCKPDTATNRQLVSDVFGTCKSFPNIMETGPPVATNDATERNEPTKKDSTENGHDLILKRTSEPGPLAVKLNNRQWCAVSEQFRQAEWGGNAPAGWIVWRIYLSESNPDSTYVPVLLKYCTENRYICYNLFRDTLKYMCCSLKHLL